MKLPFKSYNIADWFSFYRIAAAPFLLALVLFDQKTIFTWMLLISYLTDAVDGQLARRLKISSARGSQLDSIGDQLTLIMALIGIAYFEYAFILKEIISIGFVLLIYVTQMIIAWIKYGRATSFHTYLAKISFVVQSIFVIYLFWWGPHYGLFYAMVVLSVLETIEEVILIFMHPEWKSDIKGIYWALQSRKHRGAD